MCGTKAKWRDWLKDAECSERNREDGAFILAHWKRISHAEAKRRRPSLGPHVRGCHYWACDAFDDATRRCTAYDHRPPICRDFPWYGSEPNEWALTDLPQCSYWRDVPQDKWPEGTIPLRVIGEGT